MVVIDGYSINGYQWLLLIILLMDIDGYWWLFFVTLSYIMTIGGYYIINYY